MTTSSTSSAVSASTSSLAGTYGLSGSGIDVDAIVKASMTAEQTKLDTLTQKKTVLQWQKAAYNTVNDDLSTFNTALSTYKLQKTLAPNTATTSNTSVVTANASAAALDGTHSLVVAQLASAVNLTSTASLNSNSDKTSISTQLGVTAAAGSSFAVQMSDGSSSATITVDLSGTINDLVSQINNAGLKIQASYDSTLDRFFLASTDTGSAAKISVTDTTTGDTSGTGFFANTLKLFSATDQTVSSNPVNYSRSGKDAVFQLDGVGITEGSNSFTISNLSYTLTGVSAGITTADVATVANNTYAGSATGVSVSVSNDTASAVKNVQTLVDSYNKILAELNTKVAETRYSAYPPLTTAQEAAMSDTQITAWNAKAQSGMLYNDSTLTGLINNMRSAFSTVVKGGNSTYNSAASIGITTGDYTEGGKLYLDTDKLQTALSADPNVLYKLFGATGAVTTTTASGMTTTTAADGTTTTVPAAVGATDGTTMSTDWNSQGIAGRVYDSITNTRKNLQTIASTTALAGTDSSSNYALRIIALNKQLTTTQATFTTMQTAFYTQYNAMEVALKSLTSQSSFISSLTSSSGG